MRRLIPLLAVLAAGCATTPATSPGQVAAPMELPSDNHDHSSLSGMTANELVEHFGQPRLQIREGDGTKMQFGSPACILDAYLYPQASGQGLPRVAHVDTRNAQGNPVNPQNCIASLEAN